MSEKKERIKACLVEFSTFSGLYFRNVTFHDFENKIFVIGKERTKRQIKKLDGTAIIKGHLDIFNLNEKRYFTSENIKTRHYPSSLDDLKRDFSTWNDVKNLEKLENFSNFETLIKKAIWGEEQNVI